MRDMRRSVHWERLAALRTPLIMLAGLIAMVVGVFQFSAPAGWIAAGLAAVFLAYVTDTPAEADETDKTAQLRRVA